MGWPAPNSGTGPAHQLPTYPIVHPAYPTPCKRLLRPMARRGATARYAALLTLLLIAGNVQGRALRQDESPELSPEDDSGDWSPPPASPEPEASPDAGSDGGSASIAPFVAAVMKGDAAVCAGALIAPTVSRRAQDVRRTVAAAGTGRQHALALIIRCSGHDLAWSALTLN